jgi:hypothetical protein
MDCPGCRPRPRPRRCLALVAAGALTLAFVPRLHSSAAPLNDSDTAMEQFLARPITVPQYSGSRRLEASGSGQRAWLDVQTDFTPTSGFLYRVTAEGGSGYIRSRVLRSLLDEEQQLIARGGAPTVALSTENYRFAPEAVDDDQTAVVRIRPLRKDRALIGGRMFLTLDGELLRVEGLLAKNPSFWTTRVNVVRAYRRINGALMPVSLDSTAQLRLLGSSALRMTYRYSRVDDRAVDGDPDTDQN